MIRCILVLSILSITLINCMGIYYDHHTLIIYKLWRDDDDDDDFIVTLI